MPKQLNRSKVKFWTSECQDIGKNIPFKVEHLSESHFEIEFEIRAFQSSIRAFQSSSMKHISNQNCLIISKIKICWISWVFKDAHELEHLALKTVKFSKAVHKWLKTFFQKQFINYWTLKETTSYWTFSKLQYLSLINPESVEDEHWRIGVINWGNWRISSCLTTTTSCPSRLPHNHSDSSEELKQVKVFLPVYLLLCCFKVLIEGRVLLERAKSLLKDKVVPQIFFMFKRPRREGIDLEFHTPSRTLKVTSD